MRDKPESISESMERSRREADELEAAWRLGDYIGQCPKCKRHRLCACPNGKSRCEKCHWVPEDSAYFSLEGE